MATIRRANVILTVKDDQIDHYLDLGYALVDETTGEVIKEATGVPQDLSTLKTAYTNHVREIAELKAKLAKYENPPAKSEPVADDVEETVKRKRTKKSE